MVKPDLDRIVDTYVKVEDMGLKALWGQIKRDVLTPIRSLQAAGQLRWFSFLLHGHEQLGGREPPSPTAYFHIRLEPARSLDPDEFIRSLPSQFRNPVRASLKEIGGLDRGLLRAKDWAEAWRIHGEASEWVLGFLEVHDDKQLGCIGQLAQFLHFITNPLGLGMRGVISESGGWHGF